MPVSAPDRKTWKPAWCPPKWRVRNEVNGVDGNFSTAQIDRSRIRLVERNIGEFLATQTIFVKGVFYEPFELQLYPFDTQPLGIHLESCTSGPQDAFFVPKCTYGVVPVVRETEWSGTKFNTGAQFVPETSSAVIGRHALEIEAVVHRHYQVYVSRVIVVMATMSLAAVTSFCEDPNATCLERISLAVTLLLTATAYSIVISNKIPILGYLTLLDKYILGIFSFIIAVVLEIAALEWIEAEVMTQRYVMYADLGLWLFANLYFTLMVAYKRRYHEGEKGSALQRESSQAKLKQERRASFTLDEKNPLTFRAVGHVSSMYSNAIK